MSTSKQIDKICLVCLVLLLGITVWFCCGKKLGITVIPTEKDQAAAGFFTQNDLNSAWDTANATVITLEGDNARISGNGAYFSDGTVHIIYAGKYLLSGSLDGRIKIDADGDDKIWLMFDGVQITADVAPLEIAQADKVFLTLKEGSSNSLTVTGEDDTLDGAVYSRDDLTVNGSGTLTVTAEKQHGIVCNDSLVFTGGQISVTAKEDAVHAHDSISICSADLTLSAGDDALHAGNDAQDSVFYMESGTVTVTACYEGIEANDIMVAGGSIAVVCRDDGINACGGSTAAVHITGGEISILNGTGQDADGIDSNGSITVSGGSVYISLNGTGTNNALDYGSENGGACVIDGGTVVACGSSQMAEAPSAASVQGVVYQTVSAAAGDTVTLTDSTGSTLISYQLPYACSLVTLSAPGLAVGDSVTLTVGQQTTELTVDNSFETNGFDSFSGFGGFGGKGRFIPGERTDGGATGDPAETENSTPPEQQEISPDGQMNAQIPEIPEGQLPENRSQGQLPLMPQEGEMPSEDGQMPEIPEGMTTGNAPEGDAFDGETPELSEGDTFEGEPPELPEGMTVDQLPAELPQNGFDGEMPDSFGPGQNRAGDFNNPFENSVTGSLDGEQEQVEKTTEQSSIDWGKTASWLAVSVAILAVGLILVIKKK